MEAHLAQVPVGSRGLRQRVDCTSIDTTPSHAPPKFRPIKESSSYQLGLARLSCTCPVLRVSLSLIVASTDLHIRQFATKEAQRVQPAASGH